jgi:hypothetical protein
VAARSELEQDILMHFALRGAHVGGEFDLRGFWQLASAKYELGYADLLRAMANLQARGCIMELGGEYLLTQQGFTHINGREEE